MNNEAVNDIQNLELSIEDAKKAIARMEALGRLSDNQDFKDIIGKGFLEVHAVRQVLLKAHPTMQTPEAQNLVDQQIIAVGQFKQFLVGVHALGMEAKQAVAEDENTLSEILREDQDDD